MGSKAAFEDVYTGTDPRSYCATLGSLDYWLLDESFPFVRDILHKAMTTLRDSEHVLVADIGSGYGFLGSLLKNKDTMRGLVDRMGRYPDEFSSTEVLAAEQARTGCSPSPKGVRVWGIDKSESALAFGANAGWLDKTICVDLEARESAFDTKPLVDVFVCVGCVGYIGAEAFQKLLQLRKKRAYVVATCLAAYDFSPIAEVLSTSGFKIDFVRRGIPQRRVRDEAEARWFREAVQTVGAELQSEDGYLYANLYIARS